MQIRYIKAENFQSTTWDVSPILLDPQELKTLIGINDPNCQNVFRAITFISDLLSRRYKDEMSFVKSLFKNKDSVAPIKIHIGLTLNINELDLISGFIICSEKLRIDSMDEPTIGDLKMKILRSCTRIIVSKLFANPILDVTIRTPTLYVEDYLNIELRIEKNSRQFFVFPDARGEDAVITGDRNHLSKNRIFFADLLLSYLNDLDVNVDYIKYMYTKVDQNEEKKYIGIGNVPNPSTAGKLFGSIPELKPLSIYFTESNTKFAYNNPIFFDLIKTIYCNFITYTNLRSELGLNLPKLLLERIDPNLTVLEAWIKSPVGRKAAEDFERAVTLLLHLCGYNALHVGSQYENSTLQNRVDHNLKAAVALDIIGLSPDSRDILLCQCSLEWIPSKLKEISDIANEMRILFSSLKRTVELHSVFVIGVSRNNIPKDESIPDKVKIVDITDLITLLNEVKKGISPYKLASNIFL